MTPITYCKGDATASQLDSIVFLVHVCNNVGAWGAGFTKALNKWPEVEQSYISLAREYNKLIPLGKTQFVAIGTKFNKVANMVAQNGLRSKDNIRPLSYDALVQCLEKVKDEVSQVHLSWNPMVVGPRFGSNLAGGSWPIIESIIEDTLCKYDIKVRIYDLP